jgi:hypothetical protein
MPIPDRPQESSSVLENNLAGADMIGNDVRLLDELLFRFDALKILYFFGAFQKSFDRRE